MGDHWRGKRRRAMTTARAIHQEAHQRQVMSVAIFGARSSSIAHPDHAPGTDGIDGPSSPRPCRSYAFLTSASRGPSRMVSAVMRRVILKVARASSMRGITRTHRSPHDGQPAPPVPEHPEAATLTRATCTSPWATRGCSRSTSPIPSSVTALGAALNHRSDGSVPKAHASPLCSPLPSPLPPRAAPAGAGAIQVEVLRPLHVGSLHSLRSG